MVLLFLHSMPVLPTAHRHTPGPSCRPENNKRRPHRPSYLIIIIIIRLFLTRRNTSKTLQRRASTIDDGHTVSAAVQLRAVKQVSLQCDFEGVDRLEGADVMRQPVPQASRAQLEHRQRPRATFLSERECWASPPTETETNTARPRECKILPVTQRRTPCSVCSPVYI